MATLLMQHAPSTWRECDLLSPLLTQMQHSYYGEESEEIRTQNGIFVAISFLPFCHFTHALTTVIPTAKILSIMEVLLSFPEKCHLDATVLAPSTSFSSETVHSSYRMHPAALKLFLEHGMNPLTPDEKGENDHRL